KELEELLLEQAGENSKSPTLSIAKALKRPNHTAFKCPTPNLLPPTTKMISNDDILNFLKSHSKKAFSSATTNNWDAKRKRAILPTFLWDNTDEWQQTYFSGTTATTNPVNDWTATIKAFKKHKFKWLVKQVEICEKVEDAQQLYYFKRELRPDMLLLVLMHNPTNLKGVRKLVLTHEQGTDFATNANLVQVMKSRDLEKDIEFLTKQMQQILLNYATIASALITQTTAGLSKPPKPTTAIKTRPICYRCGEKGHFARNCLSKRRPTTGSPPPRDGKCFKTRS
ncbi:8367_t:CDS:2, partial [Ambispora leptoticha]